MVKPPDRTSEAGRPRLSRAVYEENLQRLQRELVKLQGWVRAEGLKVFVLFEGRDAAGKGGTIKRIAERTNPRIVRVVALGTPTEREKIQWYFQRYVAQLPAGGEIVLFDRSWYNRAGVEHVMGFCTEEEYTEFLRSCPEFELIIIRSGVILIKYWFSVSDQEQERRFQDRFNRPEKRWKLSPMDRRRGTPNPRSTREPQHPTRRPCRHLRRAGHPPVRTAEGAGGISLGCAGRQSGGRHRPPRQ